MEDGPRSPNSADSVGVSGSGGGSRPSAQLPSSQTPGPWWLNAATVKGGALVLAGLLVLAFPRAGEDLIRFVLAGVLVVAGASRVVFTIRNRHFEGTGTDLLQGGATALAGVLLFVAPVATLATVAKILAVLALFQSLSLLLPLGYRLLSQGKDAFRIQVLIRGLMLLAFGILLWVVPEGVLAAAVIVVAGLAIVAGAMMFSLGLQKARAGKRIEASAVTLWAVFLDWLKARNIGQEGRLDLKDKLYFLMPDRTEKIVTWSVMLMLSVAIATFGVLQDSTAVVIGAMLIAPLMVPILGIAAALINGKDWWPLLGRSFLVVVGGVAASIALAWIIGTWLPAVVPFESNSQITSRVNPNIIDMLIALAAGAAGAYANVSKRASDSVAGVAIAVALVPPLSVVGLNLEAGLYADAGGAMLLFTTNLVAIILSASVVFLLMGTAPIQRFLDSRQDIQSVFGLVVTAALFIAIPLSLTIESDLLDTGRQKVTQPIVVDWLACEGDFETAAYCTSGQYEPDDTGLQLEEVAVTDEEVFVAVTGSTEPPPLAPLEAELSEALGTPVTITLEFTPSITVQYSRATGERSEIPSQLPADIEGSSDVAPPSPDTSPTPTP